MSRRDVRFRPVRAEQRHHRDGRRRAVVGLPRRAARVRGSEPTAGFAPSGASAARDFLAERLALFARIAALASTGFLIMRIVLNALLEPRELSLVPPRGDGGPVRRLDARREPDPVEPRSSPSRRGRDDRRRSLLRDDDSDDGGRVEAGPARPPDRQRGSPWPRRPRSERAAPHDADLGGVRRRDPLRNDPSLSAERPARTRSCSRRDAGGALGGVHGRACDAHLERHLSAPALGRPGATPGTVHASREDRRGRDGRRLPRGARDASSPHSDQAARADTPPARTACAGSSARRS